MKNTNLGLKDKLKEKLIAKYLEKDITRYQHKSTDINILLNRVKLSEKNEKRKKIFFSTLASTGLILFGIIIFG